MFCNRSVISEALSSLYAKLFNWLFVCALLVAVGCNGGRLPVKGAVKYPDGSPVTGGTVIAEGTVDGKLVSVQANINPDGTFEFGSETPGDGALPGKYKAMIMPVALGDADLAAGKTPTVGGKYSKFETSGIQFEVVKDMQPLAITVDKPAQKN